MDSRKPPPGTSIYHLIWEDGALLSPATDWIYDGLTAPLRLATGVNDEGDQAFVEVPAGEYSGWLFNPRYTTSTQAPVVWNTVLSIGQFFSGTRRSGSTQLSFQLGGALAGEIGLEYNMIELPGPGGVSMPPCSAPVLGIPSARASTCSPSSSTVPRRRYGPRTSGSGGVDTAGTGLFIVFNERRSERLAGLADGLLERTVSIKFSRQLDMARIRRDRFGVVANPTRRRAFTGAPAWSR